MAFQKAKRTGIYPKVALIGPSGSGKSKGALRIATGMLMAMGFKKGEFDGKIAMVNTERNRGELYSDEFDYDILNMTPPFTPEAFIKALQDALDAGYKVAIVDSASHEWIGRGGCLEIVDKMPGENSYTKWGKVTPRHNAFIDFLRDSPIALIACLRGKDEYALEEINGKKVPRKIGMGAQMRDGLEYDLHLSFSLDMNHISNVEGGKDNTNLFGNRYEMLTEKHGIEIWNWATSGGTAEPQAPVSAPPAAIPNTQGFTVDGIKAEIAAATSDDGLTDIIAKIKGVFQGADRQAIADAWNARKEFLAEKGA